jgi:oligoendopeptidase F
MPYEFAHWKLDGLIPTPDPDGIEQAIKTFDAKIKKVESWRKKLKSTMSAKSFLALLHDYETAGMAGTKLYSYAMLKFYADTQDQEAVALVGRVQQLYAESENRTLFLSLWWKELSNTNARRLMKVASDRRYWLEKMRQFKPHTLSEPEEKIINIKTVNGFNALDNLHEAITNRFVFSLEADGETKRLTRDELSMYTHPPSQPRRARRCVPRTLSGV